MNWLRRLLLVGGLAVLAASAFSHAPAPEAKMPAEDILATIEKRTDDLGKKIAVLRGQRVRAFLLADVEIYHKAAVWTQRHKEYYNKDSAAWVLEVLDRGLLRASQLARGEAPWQSITGRTVVRGYRSNLDGSLQPYAVTLPADYGKDKTKRWRLDVVLHGRNDSMTEVVFLHQHNGDKAAAKDLDHVVLEMYGRGNNAYRWAGEIDVGEAIENFTGMEVILGRGELLDPARRVLRGFSMGGAGTWHLGLHYPDRWSVIGPGAGFTTTKGYVNDLKLTPTQEACLHIYDAVDYAENAFDVPVVAYAGDKDKQIQALRNIEAKLKTLGIPMPPPLIAPGLAHQMPPEWQKKAQAEYAKYANKERNLYPKKVRFVTWTLKYSGCYWVDILSMDKQYQQARVEAEQTDDGYTFKTTNVRALDVRLKEGADRGEVAVTIDGRKVAGRPYPNPISPADLHVYLEKRGDRWYSVMPQKMLTDRLRSLQKQPGLQGPIDDAFMSGFLCVVPSPGKEGWHPATDAYTREALERFRREWSKYFRGDVQIKKDEDVSPNDIATKHLILFGDPSSNTVIDQVLPGLPFQWTKDTITWQGKDYAAAGHVPVLIYPSPLNTDHYVVLNSGHTFHAEDFVKSNAMLYPRLGDFALLKLTDPKKDPLAVEVVKDGLFDDFWRWPK
jgi:hypothetical protein